MLKKTSDTRDLYAAGPTYRRSEDNRNAPVTPIDCEANEPDSRCLSRCYRVQDGSCINAANVAESSHNFCTQTDVCTSGVCGGTPVDCPACATTDDGQFQIALEAVNFDGVNTTFTYRVCRVPASQALSHWVLGLSQDCIDLLVNSSGGTSGVDPTTGLFGVKFETPVGVPDCGATCGETGDVFTVTFDGADTDQVHIVLTPRESATEVGTVRLTVATPTYDIVGAEVRDPLGNVTRLFFSDLRRNVGLDDDHFRFVAPPGVDIIEALIGY